MKALTASLLVMFSLAGGSVVAADNSSAVTQTQAELASDNYLVQLCVTTLPGATSLADCASTNGAGSGN